MAPELRQHRFGMRAAVPHTITPTRFWDSVGRALRAVCLALGQPAANPNTALTGVAILQPILRAFIPGSREHIVAGSCRSRGRMAWRRDIARARSTIRKEHGSYQLPATGTRAFPAGATSLDGILAAATPGLRAGLPAGQVRIVDAEHGYVS